MTWQPTASISTLQLRAELLKKVRRFFEERHILEVETPLLGLAPVTDPYLNTFSCQVFNRSRYLQTSPEYAMKRLLAAGSGSIYQVCKAFRGDENGRYHLSEFTMLEWYRVGFNDEDLMQEVDALLQTVFNTPPCIKVSYQDAFEKHLKINPHTVHHNTLKALVAQYIGPIQGLNQPSKDDCLQLLMSGVVEPALNPEVPTIIFDYPASQAALAQIKEVDKEKVAARFEVFYKQVELGNGYYELQDAHEQRQRFEQDLIKRQKIGASPVPMDENLLQALEMGLPSCAGVAIGFDRLAMLACDLEAIDQVVAFAHG